MSRQWKTIAAYLLAILVYAAFVPGVAAQTTSTTVVDFGPLWSYLVPFVIAAVGAVMSAGLTWIAVKFQKATGIEVDAAHRDTLKSAIVTGLNMALERLGPTANLGVIDVKSKLVAQTLSWVMNEGAKDAVAHFNITPDTLAKMILGYIQVADPAVPSLPVTPVVAAK